MNDEQIKVSVIVPVYNTSMYLEKCIDSLRKQTLHEIQIILVNDGSTDSSGEICEQFAKKDSRIVVIHKDNEGQGIARNEGLKYARGEFVAFIDSDDWVDTITYEQIYNVISRTNADAAYYMFYDNDVSSTQEETLVMEDDTAKREIIKSFWGVFFGEKNIILKQTSACNCLYRKEIIDDNNICFLSEREILSEDTFFNLDFLYNSGKVVVLNQKYYHYRINDESFSRKYQHCKIEQCRSYYRRLTDYQKKYDCEKKFLGRISINFLQYYFSYIQEEMKLCRYEQYKVIKGMCDTDEVVEAINNVDLELCGIKKRMLFCSIKKKKYWIAFLYYKLRYVFKGIQFFCSH